MEGFYSCSIPTYFTHNYPTFQQHSRCGVCLPGRSRESELGLHLAGYLSDMVIIGGNWLEEMTLGLPFLKSMAEGAHKLGNLTQMEGFVLGRGCSVKQVLLLALVGHILLAIHRSGCKAGEPRWDQGQLQEVYGRFKLELCLEMDQFEPWMNKLREIWDCLLRNQSIKQIVGRRDGQYLSLKSHLIGILKLKSQQQKCNEQKIDNKLFDYKQKAKIKSQQTKNQIPRTLSQPGNPEPPSQAAEPKPIKICFEGRKKTPPVLTRSSLGFHGKFTRKISANSSRSSAQPLFAQQLQMLVNKQKQSSSDLHRRFMDKPKHKKTDECSSSDKQGILCDKSK